MNPHTPTELLTIAQTAQLLQLSRRTVERMVSRGDLPTVLLGRARRIRADAVRRLVDGADRTA